MTNNIPFSRDLEFEYGVVDRIGPGIRRVIARNPSPFTLYGTGTYIVGEGTVAVIDPEIPEHFEALMNALKGEVVSDIVITHTHSDHSPLSRQLAQETGARICGYGGLLPSQKVKDEGFPRMEEAIDQNIKLDVDLADGDLVEGNDWTLEAVHTPGHIANHMCYAFREVNVLFSGDHVMGWSTSVIIQPDGNMSDYMNSLRLLLKRSESVYWPTHGPAINDPKPFVRAYIDHRLNRERQIHEQLKIGVGSIQAMVKELYANVPQELHPAAGQSVYAQIMKMIDDGYVVCDGIPQLNSLYALK
ncbi:MAG TPA: MBL fold metallo-hydrolase [Dehalococcoidia bacterium]|nr:MBL fold metallo-hydrolase [Dehalococcoidia bacterium]